MMSLSLLAGTTVGLSNNEAGLFTVVNNHSVLSNCSLKLLKCQSQLQQTTIFATFSQISKKIRYDISLESSASRRFS